MGEGNDWGGWGEKYVDGSLAATGRGAGAELGGAGARAEAEAEGVGVDGGVGAVVAFARLSSLPPEAPVRRRVVPTETRKMSVYFLAGSSKADSLAVGLWGRDDPAAGSTGAGSAVEVDMVNPL